MENNRIFYDNQDLEKLLNMTPSSLQIWLEEVFSGEKLVSKDFNWVALTDLAHSKAIKFLTNECKINLEWSNTTLLLYSKLIEIYPEFKDSFMVSAMYLRANLIVNLGVLKGDQLLDPKIIVDWFFKELFVSSQKAESLIKIWKTRDNDKILAIIEDIKILRSIKNRLSVIKFLVENTSFIPSEELKKWLSLHANLP